MDTPICRFVENYIAEDPLRLHMPGHKGLPLLGFEARDITEISGADVLYQPSGIIRESEKNAEALWGTARTVYSAEGSSLSIRAMLYLLRLYAAGTGRQPLVFAGRNAHKVFVSAAALLGIRVAWLRAASEPELVACRITPEDLEAALEAAEEKPQAVYITSPDYLGNVSDIGGLSRVCRRFGVLLLVDNAHGAYLRFLPESRHPMDLGADLCCDSAHKTLPVITGGAYLHISRTAPGLFAENADRAMAVFASTSPSYLILQSLDAANRYLSEGYGEKLRKALTRWDGLKARLRDRGWSLSGDEPLKLTLKARSAGYSGEELARMLEQAGLSPEYADPDYLVLMLSPEWGSEEETRLQEVLLSLPVKDALPIHPPVIGMPEQALSPTEAIFAPCETVAAAQALGRIMAAPTVSCPPAIPIAACGERIDRAALRAMAYYGIETVSVVV